MNEDVKRLKEEEVKSISGGALSEEDYREKLRNLVFACPRCKSESIRPYLMEERGKYYAMEKCNDCGAVFGLKMEVDMPQHAELK